MERRFGGSGHEGHRGAPPLLWFGGERGVSGPREVIRIFVKFLVLSDKLAATRGKEPVTEFIYTSNCMIYDVH